jgi:DNA-binding NarL/FixJ family response regulator
MQLKILIVDDVQSMRSLVKQYLRRHNEIILVGESGNASDAVEKAKALSPDLILMDISLAGVSGVEVTKEIKSFLPNTRIYLFSAFELDELRDILLNSHADGFVQKSNIKVELEAMVEKEIALRTKA